MIFLSVIDICYDGYYLEYRGGYSKSEDDFLYEDVSYFYPTIVRVSSRPRKHALVGLSIFLFLLKIVLLFSL